MAEARSEKLDTRNAERRVPAAGAVDAAGADEPGTPDDVAAAPTTAAAPAESEPDPPRTTTGGWFTAPKFGSAGSGGAELEPGPERD